MRSYLVNFSIAIGSFLLTLLILEVGARLLNIAPEVTRVQIDTPYGSFVSSSNPILKYVPRAGFGDINSEGFRDKSYPLKKPPSTHRTVVLGDSIAFGYCSGKEAIPLQSIFPKKLEDMLNQQQESHYEVLNMGVSGYD